MKKRWTEIIKAEDLAAIGIAGTNAKLVKQMLNEYPLESRSKRDYELIANYERRVPDNRVMVGLFLRKSTKLIEFSDFIQEITKLLGCSFHVS